MKHRIWEWSGIVSLLLSIGLAALWADSLLMRRRYDVLSLTSNLNILIVDGRLTLFDVNERDMIQPRIFNPRGFGQNLPKEHRYLDWIIPALGIRYCFVTGEVVLPFALSMRPRSIRYAEFTIPGLSLHRDHDSILGEVRWSLELTLLIPLVILLLVVILSWRQLRKSRRLLTRPGR